MVKHRFLGALLAGPLLLLPVLSLAACGGGSAPARSVAALSTPSSSASPAPTASQSAYQRALAYADCMRKNGVTNFPDPVDAGNGQVGFKLDKGSIDENSAQYKAADAACQKLKLGADGTAKSFDPTKIPAWVACVRKNGAPQFPYPTNTGTGMEITISGIDQNTLQKALDACHSIAPGGTLQVHVDQPGGGN